MRILQSLRTVLPRPRLPPAVVVPAVALATLDGVLVAYVYGVQSTSVPQVLAVPAIGGGVVLLLQALVGHVGVDRAYERIEDVGRSARDAWRSLDARSIAAGAVGVVAGASLLPVAVVLGTAVVTVPALVGWYEPIYGVTRPTNPVAVVALLLFGCGVLAVSWRQVAAFVPRAGAAAADERRWPALGRRLRRIAGRWPTYVLAQVARLGFVVLAWSVPLLFLGTVGGAADPWGPRGVLFDSFGTVAAYLAIGLPLGVAARAVGLGLVAGTRERLAAAAPAVERDGYRNGERDEGRDGERDGDRDSEHIGDRATTGDGDHDGGAVGERSAGFSTVSSLSPLRTAALCWLVVASAATGVAAANLTEAGVQAPPDGRLTTDDPAALAEAAHRRTVRRDRVVTISLAATSTGPDGRERTALDVHARVDHDDRQLLLSRNVTRPDETVAGDTYLTDGVVAVREDGYVPAGLSDRMGVSYERRGWRAETVAGFHEDVGAPADPDVTANWSVETAGPDRVALVADRPADLGEHSRWRGYLPDDPNVTVSEDARVTVVVNRSDGTIASIRARSTTTEPVENGTRQVRSELVTTVETRPVDVERPAALGSRHPAEVVWDLLWVRPGE